MFLWVPMIVVAVIGLARAMIDWSGRIRFERVRSAAVTAVLQATPAGAAVRDVRADGTSVLIDNSSETRSESPAPAVPISVVRSESRAK